MTAKLTRYLQQHPLFKGAPEDVLARLAEQITIKQLSKNDVLVQAGQDSDSLFIVQTGWVKVIMTDYNGEEVTLNQCGPGQVIGEMSLFDYGPRSNTVTAISPIKALEIKYSTLLQLINEYPLLVMALLQSMTERLRFANSYIGESVEWCRQISAGNYDFVTKQVNEVQSTIIDSTKSHEARASAFLSAFFKMVEQIKQREDALKEQVQQLTIEIDQVKRRQSVEEVTDNEFFKTLQHKARTLRRDKK